MTGISNDTTCRIEGCERPPRSSRQPLCNAHYIQRQRGSSFRIVEAATDHKYGFENIRVLARAPKPKPAWHDAVAVMARCSNAPEGHREPFIRSEAAYDVWAGEAGHARTDDLRDVTPLIEAKVTAEMIDRILDVVAAEIGPHPVGIGEALAVAALGLETA